ncbi:MAG: replication-associated recombination protein A [Saprospiraceae bacterium]|jgi:putative ATPase|nr:replication-associated recombination protein A [Saprospiraceae bacterium]MBP9209922.1 replication-associated recombination protein A [Saprospiraceae bacterium]
MQPLAERMRPMNLEDILGQDHLVGPGKVLTQALEKGHLPSLILWGPPGVGKTSLARILAQQLRRPFFELSAVHAGVREVRELLAKSKERTLFEPLAPILFIDEVHRFNKGQQDALLAAVEKGQIIMIGATTENPSFEINNALLSRCQVYTLKPLSSDDLLILISRILEKDWLFKDRNVTLEENEALLQLAHGDARRLCNIMELVGNTGSTDICITNGWVYNLVQENLGLYDKGGEMHYDIASAFIKSIRGSDPNAALYWLARMVEGGEDPSFIARRLVIAAAEDIGLANPNAILLATSCQQATNLVGWPECRIILAEATVYLACSPKSNSAYMGIEQALACVRNEGSLPVPLPLRNAVTGLMKNLQYGEGYQYVHDHPGNFAEQEYLPDALSGTIFYTPGENPPERRFLDYLKDKWQKHYNY